MGAMVSHFTVALGVLIFFLLSLVPDGQAQPQQNRISSETHHVSQ